MLLLHATSLAIRLLRALLAIPRLLLRHLPLLLRIRQLLQATQLRALQLLQATQLRLLHRQPTQLLQLLLLRAQASKHLVRGLVFRSFGWFI